MNFWRKSGMKEVSGRLHICFVMMGTLLISSGFVYAGYEWVLDKSTVFADDAYEVSICFGDVNNDGSVDMVLGKHKDFRTGRTVAFQRTADEWDSGTQIYASGNGNVNPVITQIDGSNWLLINRHDQNNYGGDLRFLKFDSSMTLLKSYSVSLNHPYFSDQVVANQEIYFNTRGKLAKAVWNGAGFTATQIASNGEANKMTTILADDLTGDGVEEIIYATYDASLGVRGLSLFVDGAELELVKGFTCYFTTGQFDATTAAHELLYFNSLAGEVVLVRYNSLSGMYISETLITDQSGIRAIAAFDTNYDGTDEAIMGTSNGEIFKYDIVADRMRTVLTSGVFWNDAVVADWGEGKRAVLAGSEGGDASVVAIGLDDPNAIIDDISGNSYPEGSTVDISWEFVGPSFLVHVQISEDQTNWTTVATLDSQAGFCELTDATEGEYFLRIVDLLTTVVYGQLEDPFYVYACDTILAGDVDGDCYVGFADFVLLADNWLLCTNPLDAACTETFTNGDLDNNSYVNLADFSLLAFDWLSCGNPYDSACSE